MDYIDTPRKAELNAESKMREWNYVDAKATAVGADAGIDVWSSRALAQVKFEGAVAGRPALQLLVGARKHDESKELFFFSATGYSRQALEYADEMSIALFKYDALGQVTAVNAVKPIVIPTRISASQTASTYVPTYRPTRRDWRSPDWVVLWHVLRPLGAWLKPQPVKRSSRKVRVRRRA